jgi:hypothetical protein
MDIRAAVGNPTLTYETLFTDFLKGHGIPCPTHFTDAAGTFSNIIDLSQVDSPAFRCRMFNLAATGSPLLDVTADPITVSVATILLAHCVHLKLDVCRFLLLVITTLNIVHIPIAMRWLVWEHSHFGPVFGLFAFLRAILCSSPQPSTLAIPVQNQPRL